MPQVDLETLVTACAGGGNDRKIACETLADDDASENDVIPDEDAAAHEGPADFPPESFWLSKDAEYDWFDRNVFYERKESTKGNSNSTNLNPHINPSSNSNSQRFSVNLKSKKHIIGLPKTQKATFVDSKRRTCKSANIRLFPKRSESVGKSTAPMAEPGSPKVSCMGRVRSKRCRRRSNSLKRTEKPLEKSRSTRGEKKKTGFYSKVMSIFRSKKGHKKPARSGSSKVVEVLMEEPEDVEPQRKSVNVRVPEIPVCAEPVAEAPGLGGMTRFASGRRSESWASEDFTQAVSGELDRRVGER
ncbi:Calcium/calmodulin-dependent protein kinase [Handroanthus impetiginosus]|uniref:Calcium/calmodulin-dependent protein kinase n=1 Tax=Handroanthus impetiginosus TaxID=429701 RepID=A0A2G9HPP5_9LAMI|nr:Calcium/calmodulin-dependent protein kinase [Handroanthus impetiginosus]